MNKRDELVFNLICLMALALIALGLMLIISDLTGFYNTVIDSDIPVKDSKITINKG